MTSVFGKQLTFVETAAQALDVLGFSAFAKTFLGSADAAAARTNIDAQEDVITTRGDLVVGNATPAASRLAKGARGGILITDANDALWLGVGTNGQVLSSDGTDPSWTTPAATPTVVKQVIGSATIAGSTTTSSTFVDVTGASLSITPASTSNKVLVQMTWQAGITNVAASNTSVIAQILRGATVISGVNSLIANSDSGSGNVQFNGTLAFTELDSPATTSAVTYKIQHKRGAISATAKTQDVQIVLTEVTP